MQYNFIIILANGTSKRMNYNKSNIFIKNNLLINHYKYYIVEKIKSNNIYINSNIKLYLNIPDIIFNIGPMGALYTIITYFNYLKKSRKILLLTIDMPIISKKILKFLYTWKNKYKIILYSNTQFPILMQLNYKKNDFLYNNFAINKYNFRNNSIKNFIKSKKAKILFYKIRKKLLLNINNKTIWIIIKKLLEKNDKFKFQM
ncbi:MAG: hypothetical protein HYZ30_00920 [Candidatus Azosocius agrarius]|nr:MAG: hypothetical protein HYZ30_00920 [Gammaproteobacteria bacterium]